MARCFGVEVVWREGTRRYCQRAGSAAPLGGWVGQSTGAGDVCRGLELAFLCRERGRWCTRGGEGQKAVDGRWKRRVWFRRGACMLLARLVHYCQRQRLRRNPVRSPAPVKCAQVVEEASRYLGRHAKPKRTRSPWSCHLNLKAEKMQRRIYYIFNFQEAAFLAVSAHALLCSALADRVALLGG